ncbi:MAG: flagellum-specific ATP synthase FliI, partial [Alphaproteobacteria bacterium]|nr:flagellum-specific ATP synthase FliI [Alphaproteobacteria bacterium]
MDRLSQKAIAAIKTIPDHAVYGEVTKILGLLVEIAGFGQALSIGSMVHLRPPNGANGNRDIPCEVVGFRDGHALLMPFGALEGVGLGCRAVIQETQPVVLPDERWLGRVINALG